MKKTPRKSPAPPPAEEHLPEPAAADVTPSLTPAFPIVGIGASAGGLAAFEAFFSGMPAVDPDMAFILVQHLAPDHKSILSELVRRYTRMQVFEVEDGMVVQPNCAYIIPPNRDMAFLNGALHLLQPANPRGQRLPIDYFFRSLALDQHERAICIVLSGTGSDGTLGVRAIKGEGGMVMVQTTESAEYDGMPRSALATGLVDYELPPAQMANQLIAYATHAFSNHLRVVSAATLASENITKKIFILLRNQTGHDFSLYKPNTIHRRIERRMAIHQIDKIDSYLKTLQTTPTEVESLFRDLLIGVTSFFRDPDAFKFLEEQVIPKLFIGKPASGAVRVWVPGCSTGEEAYSIAILLAERQEALKKLYSIQVFATDIDSQAIATARAGLYPASIVADLTPERLARFFTPEPDGNAYRIHKGIRDMLVFSEQNMIKDPPFSKLDLISCRNLLIYLGSELQKRLMPLFHYALNPGGRLFLGTSETVGDFISLFTTLDRKAKLYQRKDDYASLGQLTATRFYPPLTALDAATPRTGGKTAFPVKRALRELTEQALLQQVAPSGALVDSQGDILYLHGRTGLYLEPAPGETGIANILKMARDGLRRDLTLALRKAVKTQEAGRAAAVRVKTNGHYTFVNLAVHPMPPQAGAPEAPLYLVVLEDAGDSPAPGGEPLAAGKPSAQAAMLSESASIAELKQELKIKEDYLQTSNEELETANEELKSSNEEMQSVNEELQSTNEELETSKEEMQSVNEELATVNTELQNKVADLSRVNNDMNNLLGGTGIGTVFVNLQLRILRFTPAVSTIINLIASDVGRPVGHLVANLVNYTTLVADTLLVLNTLVPKSVEVQTTEGKWFSLRIQPYRTRENVIEGAVITFTDIHDLKLAEAALRKANDLLRLAVVVRDAHDAITVQDLDGRILAWNPGAERLYGWSEADALALHARDRIPEALQAKALAEVKQLSLANVLAPYRTQRLAKSGAILDVWMTATALINETGQLYAIATTERLCT